jgi:hypothetical protein
LVYYYVNDDDVFHLVDQMNRISIFYWLLMVDVDAKNVANNNLKEEVIL